MSNYVRIFNFRDLMAILLSFVFIAVDEIKNNPEAVVFVIFAYLYCKFID